MRGRAAVAVLQNRLDAAFARATALVGQDLEVSSDFARYLCVLVSGFIEAAVAELAIEHCRSRADVRVNRYAARQLARLQNLKTERLLQLMGAFDPDWLNDLERFVDGPRKDAIDSVIDLRNKIAHGDSVGLSYQRISEYYERVKEVVEFIAQKFD